MPSVFDFDRLDDLLEAWEIENQIPRRARRDAELRGRLGSDAAARAFEQLRSDKGGDEEGAHGDRVEVVARALAFGAPWVQEEARAARDPRRGPLERPPSKLYAYRYVMLLGEEADLAAQVETAQRKRRTNTEALEAAVSDVAAQRRGIKRLLQANPELTDVLRSGPSPVAAEITDLLERWRLASPWLDLLFRVHALYVAVNDRERALIEDETRSFLHRIVGRLGGGAPPMAVRYRVHVELVPVSARLDDKSGVGSTLTRVTHSSVEEYTDFQAFLKSHRPGAKRGDAVSTRTYREWAEALYESRDAVASWFDGHAAVPRKRVAQLGELLGLDEAEIPIFERLHAMNHGHGEERRNARRAWAQAVVEAHGRLLDPYAHKAMIHWRDWAIREIAALRDVPDDVAAIAALLGPSVTTGDVEESLARLRSEAIVTSAGGRLKATPIALDPASTTERSRIPQYDLHASAHRRALATPDSPLAADQAMAGAVVLDLTPTDWPKLDDACRRYCHAVLGECSSSRAEKTRVMQVALHAFPLDWRRIPGAQ